MHKLLWWIVISGLLASLPLGYERIITERSSKKVELVFDYRDLVEISDYQANPQAFIDEQLAKMKQIGITSMAVYESTLDELRLQRRIQLFSSAEMAILTGRPMIPSENFTYLLFPNPEVQQAIAPLIEQEFGRLRVPVQPWSFEDRSGLMIEMPADDARIRPLDPDPMTLRYIQEQGFEIAVRLSDIRLPFSEDDTEALLADLSGFGVHRIIFGGDAVKGYADNARTNSIASMAELMNVHHIGVAAIETSDPSKRQKGLNKLAYMTNYNVVRLHSLSEKEALEDKQVIADRFVLAVTDRNVRMIYLNAAEAKDPDKSILIHPLNNLYRSLEGPEGAIQRIKDEGYTIGTAEPFEYVHSGWQKPLKVVVLLGGIAFIALALAAFVPQLLLALFLIGCIGTAGLYLLSPALLTQAMALGVGICASTLAVILAIRSLDKRRGAYRDTDGWSRLAVAFRLIIRTSLISLAGAVYVVGLLNAITYALVLEQFRGVSVLHLVPILLIGIYLLLFDQSAGLKDGLQRSHRILFMNINMLLALLAAIGALGIFYYLSRTGNEGQITSYEQIFRALMENTLGVRPRTKEFLLAHPLFIAAVYFSLKYRKAVYLFIVAVIGQLSIVDTFAHLHTPIAISLVRVTYGVLLGSILGAILVAGCELLIRGWNKWVRPALQE